MKILLIILVIGVFIGGFILYRFIMNRGKNCPECKEQYDSSCVIDARVIKTVKAAMGADYNDVAVTLRCKKCGKVHKTTVTIKGKASEQYLDDEIKNHFDK